MVISPHLYATDAVRPFRSSVLQNRPTKYEHSDVGLHFREARHRLENVRYWRDGLLGRKTSIISVFV